MAAVEEQEITRTGARRQTGKTKRSQKIGQKQASEHNPGDELGKKVSRSEETIRKARKQECGDIKGSSIEETNKER